MYILFEGLDGSGKDTQADLLTRHLGPSTLRVNEPDDSLPTGKLLRQMLKEGSFVEAHAAMFLADRMALLASRVKPALEEGRHVVSVRSWMSTLVYQQENWPLEWLVALHQQLPCKASHLILLDIEPWLGLQRTQKRAGPTEFYERLDIMKRNRVRYLSAMEMAGQFLVPGGKAIAFNASGAESEIHTRVCEWLARNPMK